MLPQFSLNKLKLTVKLDTTSADKLKQELKKTLADFNCKQKHQNKHLHYYSFTDKSEVEFLSLKVTQSSYFTLHLRC